MERASRLAFLIDGAAYYAAFVDAVERAQRSIVMVGWDVDSRTRLARPGRPAETLSDLLNRVVARRKGLHVNLLSWDFAMIYALERELFPVYQLGWRTHRRVHFKLDSDHPLGASHHQKIVVIDDAIAFSGGLDITTHRWDTRHHIPGDPRRRDPDNVIYTPFHDVQVAVSGDAARALGDLVRERWRRATGRSLRPPTEVTTDPWPETLKPDIEDINVSISRTEPAYRGRPEVREVEALFVDSIKRAKRSIYIENQYTTNAAVAEALAARLAEKGGPEIVIVCPRVCSGWMERQTMGVLRAGFLNRLKDADHEGRLRIFWPRVDENVEVFVHSKIFVVDDEFCRVGSANISNRSMRVDTECDISLEAHGEPRVQVAIAQFRNRLLGEHLGVPASVVEEAIAQHGSLVQAVESFRYGPRTLQPIDTETCATAEPDDIVRLAADPEKPIDPDDFVERVLFEDEPALRARLRVKALVTFLVLIALAAAWSFTPLSQWIGPVKLSMYVDGLRNSAFAPFAVMGAFAIASLLMVPVNVLILATGITFGPSPGVLYALLGVLSAASVGYGSGRLLGRDLLRRISSSRINQLSRRLARRGVLAIAAARVVPVAPFGVVNLVAGASYIRFGQFVVGTLMGNLPGIVLVTVFGPGAIDALATWEPSRIAVVLGICAAVVLFATILTWARRRFGGEKKIDYPNPSLAASDAGAG